jgi:hypothetical protein
LGLKDGTHRGALVHAGKSVDSKSVNRRWAFTVADEFGEDFANSGCDLESGA